MKLHHLPHQLLGMLMWYEAASYSKCRNLIPLRTPYMLPDCMTSENAAIEFNGIIKVSKDLNHSEKTGKDDIHDIKRITNDISLMSTLTTLHGDDTRTQRDNQIQQRAEALESLHQLCAWLLQQGRPFGEEAISSGVNSNLIDKEPHECRDIRE
uniref:Uncharacterized protein n=1 Tax=Nelumbo nucifera TaxID=4432 RepID=A0A822YFP0_NELNU|nr:TPA_asm: hypothetical protein HUJ06_031274 [Nelumbo nucifera]